MPGQNNIANNGRRTNGKRKRNYTPKVSTKNVETNAFAYNTTLPYVYSVLGDYLDSSPHNIKEIREYSKNPQYYNKELRDLAWWAYNTNGSVKAAVNYICSMHTLDKVIVCKSRRNKQQRPRNFESNRLKMLSVLDKINYKQHIRDNLMKDANDGTAFFYFETGKRPANNAKYLSDYDIANIVEINELGLDVSIITLPVDWCRICGRISNHYRCAFNLRYFEQFTEKERKARLQAMPKEIRDGWNKHDLNNPWLVLDDTKTIVTKVNAAINQPWGVPMAVTAFDDILYAEYFINTKRTVLDNINNQIIYMTFPEGKEKGTSSLSKDQQKDQHEKVKDAVINRKSQSGISFFSLASGTKLDKMEVDIGIFDEKNEASIKNNVPADLGISSASLDGNTKGNYATASLNLELVASHVYTWIENFMAELNKCINVNVIKDSSCVVDCYILPTTFSNRDKQVQYMKDLYSNGKGSLLAWISATGFDADAYISLLDYEVETDMENKYPVHATSYTMSGKDNNSEDDKGGRTSVDNPTNENTIQSQSSGSNSNPKPSTE
nr:MAG TPA: Portal protein [Caudoviricetes sp.]